MAGPSPFGLAQYSGWVSVAAEGLRHLEVLLQHRQGLLCKGLQGRIRTGLRLLLELRDVLLVIPDLVLNEFAGGAVATSL